MDEQHFAFAYAWLTPGFVAVYIILIASLYLYLAFVLQTIARRTKNLNSWFAWVPILNIFLMLQIAEKPAWWIILIFIPVVNILAIVIIGVIVWMAIAKKCDKPRWLGILMVIPLVNIIIPGYLAWSK